MTIFNDSYRIVAWAKAIVTTTLPLAPPGKNTTLSAYVATVDFNSISFSTVICLFLHVTCINVSTTKNMNDMHFNSVVSTLDCSLHCKEYPGGAITEHDYDPALAACQRGPSIRANLQGRKKEYSLPMSNMGNGITISRINLPLPTCRCQPGSSNSSNSLMVILTDTLN